MPATMVTYLFATQITLGLFLSLACGLATCMACIRALLVIVVQGGGQMTSSPTIADDNFNQKHFAALLLYKLEKQWSFAIDGAMMLSERKMKERKRRTVTKQRRRSIHEYYLLSLSLTTPLNPSLIPRCSPASGV